MGNHRFERYALGGVAVLLMPALAGCPATRASFLGDTDARSAFMVNEAAAGNNAGFADSVVAQGKAATSIAKDGSTLSYFITSDEVHDMTDLVDQGGEFYTSPTGYAVVTDIPDVDNDGTPDDTFLVFTGNNPQSQERTEYTMAYHGTRTDTAVVDELRDNGRSATYTGTGNVRGAVGSDEVDLTGDLTMTAHFDRKDDIVQGRIDNLIGLAPAVAFDEVDFDGGTFSGSTGDARPADFDITGVRLSNGGSDITTVDGSTSGTGSYFGPRAGGTIGVFSYSGRINSGVDPAQPEVHLLGSFHGSTTDNN